MSDVVSMFGTPSSNQGDRRKANPSCVVIAERIHEMVMSGEIVGLAVVGVYPDQSVTRMSGGHVVNYSTIGAMERTKDEIMNDMRGDG